MPCHACGALNEEVAYYCRFCGEKLGVVASEIPSMVGVGVEAAAMEGSVVKTSSMGISPMYEGSSLMDSARSSVDEVIADLPLPPHENMIAKLDMMERELEVEVPEPSYVHADEPVPYEYNDALVDLSSTLDSLIADLIEVEIKEYAAPDFIHPDESGFPSRDPGSYNKKNKVRKGLKLQEVLVIIAFIAAIFLVGMSCGLWGVYFLGL
jgi:hypothetical protein